MTLGLDDSAEHLIEDETFATPTALVLGAEGKGLRELTRDKLRPPGAHRHARADRRA